MFPVGDRFKTTSIRIKWSARGMGVILSKKWDQLNFVFRRRSKESRVLWQDMAVTHYMMADGTTVGRVLLLISLEVHPSGGYSKTESLKIDGRGFLNR
jgi:hypothetical protein